MEEFIGKLNEYLVLAEEAIGQVAPEVWDLTLLIIRVQGIMWAMWAVLWAAVAIAIWSKYAKRVWRWRCEKEEELEYGSESGIPTTAWVILFPGLSGIVPTIIVCDSWFLDLDTWLSIIEPKAALVYRLGQSTGIF